MSLNGSAWYVRRAAERAIDSPYLTTLYNHILEAAFDFGIGF